ncbi:MAG: hypothetical protein H0T11_08660 [Chthoniobacterales bacterium]|nr:hypothetical protein [Chthoniobacterales bacterium]
MVERQRTLGALLVFLNQKGLPCNDIDEFRQTVVDRGLRWNFTRGNEKWRSEIGEWYFRDRNGRFLSNRFLYLDARPGAPLPDIVCRSGTLQFRTCFYGAGDETDFEVMIESR